jgi:hypothetical protein
MNTENRDYPDEKKFLEFCQLFDRVPGPSENMLPLGVFFCPNGEIDIDEMDMRALKMALKKRNLTTWQLSNREFDPNKLITLIFTLSPTDELTWETKLAAGIDTQNWRGQYDIWG